MVPVTTNQSNIEPQSNPWRNVVTLFIESGQISLTISTLLSSTVGIWTTGAWGIPQKNHDSWDAQKKIRNRLLGEEHLRIYWFSLISFQIPQSVFYLPSQASQLSAPCRQGALHFRTTFTNMVKSNELPPSASTWGWASNHGRVMASDEAWRMCDLFIEKTINVNEYQYKINIVHYQCYFWYYQSTRQWIICAYDR